MNCACHCKDTHFEAIHNGGGEHGIDEFNCACHCKDTHFEAIHNEKTYNYLKRAIVLATAKIHILKQFTTFLLR